MYKYLFALLLSFLSIIAEEIKVDVPDGLYDPDSLALVAILDTNSFEPEIYFWECIKLIIPDIVQQDTVERIAMLYLSYGTIDNPDPLPGPLYRLPHSIGDLNRLSCLILPHHELEHIPMEIGNIAWMQGLDLRFNPLKEIPAEIAQCSMLFYLGLAHTDITSLPDEFLDLDSIRPCNIAVDTINGNIYPRNVIDLCGLENFTLTERQKAWAGVADYEEYKQKYCQETAVKEPEVVVKKPNQAGIYAAAAGYSIRLTLEREGTVSLYLFNSAGKRVARVLRRKVLSKGCHTIPFSKNISPGVYFLGGKFNGAGFSGKVLIKGGI